MLVGAFLFLDKIEKVELGFCSAGAVDAMGTELLKFLFLHHKHNIQLILHFLHHLGVED
ncbi:unnamed protein product, partial [Prunus brigantina]